MVNELILLFLKNFTFYAIIVTKVLFLPKKLLSWRVKPPIDFEEVFEMKIGFYAGSFDPFTNGHLNVIKKSAKLFDEVIVGIGTNSQKQRKFDAELMKEAIQKVLVRENLTNVNVVSYSNLSVDVAVQYNATVLVRGLRNGMDYEYEENISSINEEISNLDTIYIRAGRLGNISSSMVMELLKHAKNVSKYLPLEVFQLVSK